MNPPELRELIAAILNGSDQVAEAGVSGSHGQHITGTLADGTRFAFLHVTP